MKTNCKKAPKSLAHSWDVASPFSSYEGMTCRLKETETLSKSGWTIKPIIVCNIMPSGGGHTHFTLVHERKEALIFLYDLASDRPWAKERQGTGKKRTVEGFSCDKIHHPSVGSWPGESLRWASLREYAFPRRKLPTRKPPGPWKRWFTECLRN